VTWNKLHPEMKRRRDARNIDKPPAKCSRVGSGVDDSFTCERCETSWKGAVNKPKCKTSREVQQMWSARIWADINSRGNT